MIETITYRMVLSLTVVALIGCNNQESSVPQKEELPERIDSLENLTVYPADSNPPMDVAFERDQTFGEPENEEIFLGTVPHIAVDGQDRVYIADGSQIRVFNPDGSYRTTLGREGRGPGEFNNMEALEPKIQSDRMYVRDDVLQRINVYRLDMLEFSHTIPLNPDNWSQISELKGATVRRYFVRDDHKLLVGFREPQLRDNVEEIQNRYYLMDQEGRLVSDQLFQHIDANFSMGFGGQAPPAPGIDAPLTVASTRSSLIDMSEKGTIYSIWTEDFLVKVHDPDGSYRRAFYYPYDKSSLDRNDIIDNYRSRPSMLEKARATDIPDTWPAVHNFMVDDQNRFWIAAITDDEDTFEWWILENDSSLIAKFDWPGERLKRHQGGIQIQQIRTVKNDYVYTVEEEESGEKQVIRYKIKFDEKVNRDF